MFVVWIKELLLAPVRLVDSLGYLARHSASRRQDARVARTTKTFDYGTEFSVRELASAASCDNHYQVTDVERNQKLLQRHVLEMLVRFLDEHGVDTQELSTRQNVILNQGVIQTGGTSTIGALAVGKRASAVQVEIPTHPLAGRPS